MKALYVKINLFEKDLSGSDASISLKGTHLVYIHSGEKYSSEKNSVHADVYFKYTVHEHWHDGLKKGFLKF